MKKIIVFILVFSVFSFSSEGRLDKALRLSKNPATQTEAAERLLEIAMEGNTVAMTALGRLYLYGKGVPQDCPKAMYFLLNSLSDTPIHKRNPEAMKEIANMFKRGLCVDKDKGKYLKYYKRYLKMKSEDDKSS